MLKPTVIMGSLILLVLAVSVFQVERYVQSLRTELEEVNRQLRAGHEEIHVLEAEWAYLNQPSRLRDVASNYLDIDMIDAKQIGQVETMAYRPVMLSSK